MTYKIVDIRNVKTGNTRLDDKYVDRIGCIVKCDALSVNSNAYLHYIKDNSGLPKTGVFLTSPVRHIGSCMDEVMIETMNSVYFLEEVENK